MASQSQGIQQLLQAEKRAAEKISEARKRKARRLKQAKEEAQQEIEEYRKERDRQFKEFETRHLGSREDAAAKIDKDTQKALSDMHRSLDQNKEAVIKQLFGLVCDVKADVHRNIRFKQNLGAPGQ